MFIFRSLPEIDGLSKETVLTSWLAKFDCILKGTGAFFTRANVVFFSFESTCVFKN